ncbi:metal/formaldehyde-sensitive transcriptional repressor [Sphingobium boeckii]|uniref:DNA-binding FrmR family transcriptional regulator n=1 Tax=Sphingobium boeckii TaxID=1082345 RepID=A0A7W9EH10_9SPHN|nr:metal/formaldehyde-sensitive transcriptional repressor [Sphingobium boeckii]MBB5687650.1 DNA-binding FrmR family transcriptional regulator [Sphingobium boeckii]
MHAIRDKDRLLARVKRIAGQVAAIERALSEEADCSLTLQQVAAARGAISGLMEEIMAQHLREHVAGPDLADADRAARAEEVIALLHRYGR